MKYKSVREFRASVKEAFDVASSGETVHIMRSDEEFLLVSKTAVQKRREDKSDQFAQEYTPPNLEKKVSEAAPQEVTTSELGELPCCAAKKPCKHWTFDDSKPAWVNSRSGREKEVE